jgi:hypothetical protein
MKLLGSLSQVGCTGPGAGRYCSGKDVSCSHVASIQALPPVFSWMSNLTAALVPIANNTTSSTRTSACDSSCSALCALRLAYTFNV